MVNNIYRFRRIKWGDPKPKLKVLVEDISGRPWLERISGRVFALMVVVVMILAFVFTSTLTLLLH